MNENSSLGTVLSILCALFYLIFIQPWKVEAIFISVLYMRKSGTWRCLITCIVGTWWSWDLDLPSESQFLSTMLYLIYCVGYHWCIHSCNRFLVTVHFGWGEVLDFSSRKMVFGVSMTLKELMSARLSSHWAEYRELWTWKEHN